MATAIASSDKRRPPSGEVVFCRYFRHWRTGRLVYPKRGKFFCFRRKR